MKNASSAERLSSTTGNGGSSPTDLARRVKNLFTSSSPLNKKRSMSLDELDSKPAASVMFGVPLTDLCQRESSAVPFLVRRIVKHIEDVGLDQEGIYRINGNTRIIDKLKMDFNRDGNANFGDVEIHAISSLLKLFLRELPDGVVPRDFVPHFAGVQQSYPSEASPEALNKLKGRIRLLPTTNYNMLNYLIQHLTRVAKHSDRNKMTSVSLSIVFGPNIFPCGSGIEALKTQGYCNATTCRLIQNYRTLFDRRRGQKREPPEKPVPYVEHKRQKTEAPSAEPADTATGSTHDLEASHSERSIDEAIERSSGTLSPLSPTPMPVEEVKPKASPPPPPASPPKSASPLMLKPYQGDGRVKKLSLGRSKSLDSGSSDEALVASSDEANTNTGGVEQSFHRQYAKRGMRFKARLSEGSISQRPPLGSPGAGGDQVVVLRHPHLNVLNSREEEVMRTPSPYSWQSSPGTSPPTSPVLTPRSSRVVSLVIEDTIKNFLFQPSESSNKNQHEGSPDKIKDKSKTPKADVYGLLLPEADTSVQKEVQSKPATGKPVQRRHTVTGDSEVIMRRTKKTRNRKSAVYGESDDVTNNSNTEAAATGSTDKTKSPVHDMKVKLVSFSPENSIDNGDESSDGVLETRQGKVSDLVKQFEEEEKATEAKQQSNGSTGGENSVKEAKNDESEEKVKGKKKRPTSKAFDMFEKSGMIMGMGGPSSHSKARAVSFALEVRTIPASTSSSTTSMSQTPEESRDSPQTMDGTRDSPRAADGSRGSSRATEGSRGSSRATLTTLGSTISGSEDLTTASKDFLSVSTCDEDVFTSPNHSQRTSTSSSVSPSHGKQQQRDHLSTTASDDVFVSPVHAAANQSTATESTDGGSSELDTVKRSESTLEHLTLSRPRGPVARKKPRRASAPISSQATGTPATSSNTTTAATTTKGEVKVLITSVEQTREESIKEAALPKDNDVKSQLVVQNMTPSSATVGRVAQPEQEDERTKVERTRTKSAPEVNEKVDSSQDQPTDSKKSAKNIPLNIGEDTTDGGEQRKRRSSQKDGRSGILKESGSTSKQKRKRHTVADTEQLRTSDTGGVEVTPGAAPAIMSKMPLIDLTSLAPEKQQAVSQVTEGWKEKEGTTTTAKPIATSSLRDTVQRIHELKSEIRKFEEDFTSKHGHKPSSTEKSPVRTQLEELSRLRKKYKELKEKEKVSEGSAKDEPDHAVITVASLQTDIGSEVVSPKLQGSQATSNDSGTVDRNPTTASVVGGSRPRAATIGALPSSKESAEKPRDTTKSASLQQNLDKIMTSLDTRRKSAGRPDDMTLMTKQQALQEKQMIQKALLSFEKTFGRPQTKSDKEVMKPLYDRYRQIKKLCSGDFQKESHDSVSTLTPRLSLPGALESTSDSLPSVTLLQQSTMAKSLPSAPSGYTNPDEPHSKSAFDLLKSPSTAEPRRATISAHPTELLMGDKQLQSASIEEMKHQKELLLARKKELRIILKEFESTFVGHHGRSVTRADRKPMQSEYDEYKSIKTRLLTVDDLLKKANPQKTI